MNAFYVCDVKFGALAKKLEDDRLFGKYDFRKSMYAHTGMKDIWVRYNDPIKIGEGFNDEHTSVWYPIIHDLPEVVPICAQLMAIVAGERLGGVLITKLPPGGEIKRHVDSGWHADYYDKFYVPIKNGAGSRFCWDGLEISPSPGQVYQFDNSVPHWVVNGSTEDRIAMIICIKTMQGSLNECR